FILEVYVRFGRFKRNCSLFLRITFSSHRGYYAAWAEVGWGLSGGLAHKSKILSTSSFLARVADWN
ncbi:hypothetical protein, partial [Corynebacterium casei]|uniref:hypothetical protein n=1 Tax=Corynebacterium casei TaxID=160386 RepID=UPI003F8F92AD